MELQFSGNASALHLNAKVLERVSVNSTVVFSKTVIYPHCQDQHHPVSRVSSVPNATWNTSYEKPSWYLNLTDKNLHKLFVSWTILPFKAGFPVQSNSMLYGWHYTPNIAVQHRKPQWCALHTHYLAAPLIYIHSAHKERTALQIHLLVLNSCQKNGTVSKEASATKRSRAKRLIHPVTHIDLRSY